MQGKELLKRFLTGFDEIQGWLIKDTAYASALITQYQSKMGYAGNLCEIGVFHGKYAIALLSSLTENEKFIAIDIFSNQDLNQDLKGYDEVGSYSIHSLHKDLFLENVVKFQNESTLNSVVLIDSDSLNVTESDIKIDRTEIRFFSIDGGHSSNVFKNDLELAINCLSHEGIVSIDDILNSQWPGIITETVRFFDSQDVVRPLAFLPNKLLCCRKEMFDEYRQVLRTALPQSLERTDVEFSNFLCDQYMDGRDYEHFDR